MDQNLARSIASERPNCGGSAFTLYEQLSIAEVHPRVARQTQARLSMQDSKPRTTVVWRLGSLDHAVGQVHSLACVNQSGGEPLQRASGVDEAKSPDGDTREITERPGKEIFELVYISLRA